MATHPVVQVATGGLPAASLAAALPAIDNSCAATSADMGGVVVAPRRRLRRVVMARLARLVSHALTCCRHGSAGASAAETASGPLSPSTKLVATGAAAPAACTSVRATAGVSHGRTVASASAADRERERRASAIDDGVGTAGPSMETAPSAPRTPHRRRVDRRRGEPPTDTDGTRRAVPTPDEADPAADGGAEGSPEEAADDSPVVTVEEDMVELAKDVSVYSVEAAARPTARAVVAAPPPLAGVVAVWKSTKESPLPPAARGAGGAVGPRGVVSDA